MQRGIRTKVANGDGGGPKEDPPHDMQRKERIETANGLAKARDR